MNPALQLPTHYYLDIFSSGKASLSDCPTLSEVHPDIYVHAERHTQYAKKQTSNYTSKSSTKKIVPSRIACSNCTFTHTYTLQSCAVGL
eukprot:SAG25_NODE_274_length_10583_cov_9.951068_6_plen_89_part_00